MKDSLKGYKLKNGRECKKVIWYDISSKKIPSKCIIISRKVNTNHEERLRIMLNDLKIIIPAANTKLGKKALKQYILTQFCQKVKVINVTKFMEGKLTLSALSYFLLYNLVLNFLSDISIKANKSIQQVTIEDLQDLNHFQSAVNRTKNQATQYYLKQLFKACNPFTLFVEIESESGVKVAFQHPSIQLLKEKLIKRGNLPSSIESNLNCQAKRFFSWLVEVFTEFNSYSKNNIPIWEIKREHLLSYKRYLERSIANGTYTKLGGKKHFQFVKRIFSLMYQIEHLSEDIIKGIPNIRSDEKIARVIPSNTELLSLFNAVYLYSEESDKEVLAFSFMLLLGFRCCEVVSLKWENFNFGTKTVSFVRKGGKYQILPLPELIIELIDKVKCGKDGYVFSDMPEKYEKKLKSLFKMYLFVSEWDHSGGLHIFRHIFCTKIAEISTNLNDLKELAGHESLITTSKYVHMNSDLLSKKFSTTTFIGGLYE